MQRFNQQKKDKQGPSKTYIEYIKKRIGLAMYQYLFSV